MRALFSSARQALLAGCLIAVAATAAAAGQRSPTMGPNACMNCHDHQAEKLWATTKDGPPPKSHLNSLKQLESTKGRSWVRKLAVASAYAPEAGCVRCHATVTDGDAAAGVSCESCHGPGRGYAVLHQDKGTYQASVAAGMFDTQGKPEAWVRLCVSCHVVDDRRLIAAGHPSGDTFDVVKQVVPVVHWKRVEDPSAVAAAGRAAVTAALDRRREATTAAAGSAPPGSAPPAPPAAAPPAGSSPAAAEAVLLATLEDLIRRGAYSPRATPMPPILPYTGPDAALLRLQQEIIALGIEALRTRPTAVRPQAR